MKFHLAALYVGFLAPLFFPLKASGDVVEWHSTNFQLLFGGNYKLGDNQRTIFTMEHANRWRYGDLYIFWDWAQSKFGGSNFYGEISPRFSFSRMLGKDFSKGIIQDVLLSANVEVGKGHRAYLLGGAVDLKLPGFTFLRTNLYWRDNPILDDRTWQFTVAWNRTFTIGGSKWLAEGFLDVAGEEGPTYKPNEHLVPRFLWDTESLSTGTIYLGFEWEYWHQKLGKAGITESNPQLQIKWVF